MKAIANMVLYTKKNTSPRPLHLLLQSLEEYLFILEIKIKKRNKK